MNPLIFQLFLVAELQRINNDQPNLNMLEIENPDIVKISDIDLHCSVIPTVYGSNSFKASVKPAYYETLEAILKNQASKFFKSIKQENPFLMDRLFRKLKYHDPSDIKYFKELENSYNTQEDFFSSIFGKPVMKTASWLLDNFGFSEQARKYKFKSLPEKLKNAVIYHNLFKPLFEAYHKFHQLKSQDCELLIQGLTLTNFTADEIQEQIFEEGEIYLTSIEIKTDSYEVRAQTAANAIKKSLSRLDSQNDQIYTIYSAYKDFTNAIKSIIESKSDLLNTPYYIFRSLVSYKVIDFVNHPVETSSVNVYGVFCPVVNIYDDYFYMNKDQIKTAIKALKKSQEKERIRTQSKAILFISILLFILAIIFNHNKVGILFAIISISLMVAYIIMSSTLEKNPYSVSWFESSWYCLEKFYSLFFNYHIDPEEKNIRDLKTKERLRSEGRNIMRKMLEDSIANQSQDLLLRIRGSNEEGFTLEEMLLFPDYSYQYFRYTNSSYLYPIDYNQFYP